MTDLKKKTIITGVFLLSIFFLSLVSATITTPNQVSLNNENPSQSIEFVDLNSSIALSLSSSISAYAELNFYTADPTNRWVTISLKPNVPVGNYVGSINYFEGMTPVGIYIEENETQIESDIIIFPTSKVVTVKQGSEKTQSIMITVPANYPRTINIQSVDFNPGTETILFGDLNLGQVAPGSSIQIPIVFSGIDAQTGSYFTQLSILATDSEGQVNLPTISLTLQVTAGVTPVTGDTFSTPPTCSLSATTLNLNNTYSFTCSGVVSNLDIDIPSSDYYVGKNVEVSGGIYRYDFMPTNYGEVEFKAEFKYNGASIFQPFKQDIRISSAGSLVPGTSLKFIFTPKLDQATGDEDTYLIQLADNKTGSLVSEPRIWINAIELNTSSSGTFQYSFEPNIDYEIRGKSPGYEDFVETINIKPQKIEIRISPGTGDTLTTFSINTSVDNATITIGGKDYYGIYVGSLPGGVNEIKAVKDGYKTEIINFTVDDRVRIVSVGGEFKKGIDQNFTLNTNSSWIVYLKGSMDDIEREEIARGTGNLISFLPDKKGVYVIEAEGMHIGTYEIPGFSFSNKWWIFPAWAWFLIFIPIVIIIIILGIRKKMRSSYNQESQDGAGLSFNVGDEQ